jgi:hypothetical protein
MELLRAGRLLGHIVLPKSDSGAGSSKTAVTTVLFFGHFREDGAMADTAVTELQQQIEEVRREAFAAGYAAAMQAIRDLAARPAPGSTSTARRDAVRGRRTTTRSSTTAATRSRAGAGEGTASRRRSAAGR